LINELKKLLEDPTASILFLTGAGISTPSGIPDFKTQSSNWKFEKTRDEVISIGFFRAKPERFWEIYPSVFGNY